MSNRNFKHDLFAQFARVDKTPGNGTRLELLDYLAQGERGVDQLDRLLSEIISLIPLLLGVTAIVL